MRIICIENREKLLIIARGEAEGNYGQFFEIFEADYTLNLRGPEIILFNFCSPGYWLKHCFKIRRNYVLNIFS